MAMTISTPKKGVAAGPWLALVSALALLGGLLAVFLVREHDRVKATEEDRLRTQVRVIDANLGRQIEAVRNALSGMIKELPGWKRRGDWDEAAQYLEALRSAMPGVRTLVVLDEHGNCLASNRNEIIGGNFAERAYFAEAKSTPAPGLLIVSPPFQISFGIWGMNVGLAVPGENGGLSGVVSATLDPGYFDILMRSVLYAPDMWSSLAHEGGLLFLMNPQRPGVMGMNIARPGSFFTRHLQSGQVETVMTGTVYATGEKRMMAMRTIRPEGIALSNHLVIAVGRDISAMYARFSNTLALLVPMYLAVCLTSAGGLYWIRKRRREHMAAQAKLDEALRLSIQRLALAAETAGLGVFEYDYDSGRLIWDEGMFAIYGVDPAGFSPGYDTWRNRVHGEDIERIEAEIGRLAEDGETFTGEFRIRRGDGEERVVLAKCGLFRGPGGENPRLIGINEDVTEHRRIETELRESRDRLEQRVRERTGELEAALAQLVEAKKREEAANRGKSEFLANVSHELRTPLNPILGMADLLLESDTDEERRVMLLTLRKAASGLHAMIERLIALIDLDTRTPVQESFSVRDLLEGVTGGMAEEAKAKGLEIGSELDPDLPALCVSDRGLLALMLSILAGNAVKFTNAGRVDVLAQLTASRPDAVEAAFTVRDTGIGIAADRLPRVVDGLVQAQTPLTKRFGGLGLGLATVRKIAQLLGAGLEVQSEPGRGTAVVVRLSLGLCDPTLDDNCPGGEAAAQ